MSDLSNNSHNQRTVSLFGPILLIALGFLILYYQFNPLTRLHWLDVLRLWPLFLIFIGLNILAHYAPGRYAVALSAIIAAVAVFVFGYVLINGYPEPWTSRAIAGVNWKTDTIEWGSAEDIKTAEYDFVIGPPGADLYALEDSNDLISGDIVYQDNYQFSTDVNGSNATVHLAPQNNNEAWVFVPEYWRQFASANRWQIGLNQNVPADLDFEIVAGQSRLDLSDLELNSLSLQNNAGTVELPLPGGNYDAQMQNNAAVGEIILPDNGRQDIDLEVNMGAVTLQLPPNRALRVEVDRSLGNFNANNAQLRRLSPESNVWQTPNYDEADERIDLKVHINMGTVTVN